MSLRRNVISSSPVRYTSAGSMSRMFLWSRQQHRRQQGSDVTSCRHTELQNCNCTEGGRSAHRVCAPSRSKIKFTPSDLEKWNAVSALKAGEDRATYLGLGMLICSIVLAFLLGTKLVRSYNERYMLTYQLQGRGLCYTSQKIVYASILSVSVLQSVI
ncbi:uncharacterized protein s100p isoform X3 [Scyliorhinus torazame]|uniref:uncharacterized protein s100p isoform X3 n=1 Tax=Scyliorhinus torazame TaxID=75743 RepID=UPI003B5D0358